MSIEQFESYSLAIGLTFLMGYMTFIIGNLARQSNAGRMGTFALFLVLGMGMFGFIVKTALTEFLSV